MGRSLDGALFLVRQNVDKRQWVLLAIYKVKEPLLAGVQLAQIDVLCGVWCGVVLGRVLQTHDRLELFPVNARVPSLLEGIGEFFYLRKIHGARVDALGVRLRCRRVVSKRKRRCDEVVACIRTAQLVVQEVDLGVVTFLLLDVLFLESPQFLPGLCLNNTFRV